MSAVQRHGLGVAGIAALAIALGGVPLGAIASPYEPVRHTIAGERVAVYNLLGSLEVVPGQGSSVTAEVTFAGKDAARLEVRKGLVRGRQTLRVVYPGDRVVDPEFGVHSTSTIRVRDDGTFGDEGDEHHGAKEGRRVVISGKGPGLEASANVKLFVPKGQRLDIFWGHGDARVARVEADLAIDAGGMPIEVTGIRGALAVDVGSGDIHVTDAKASIAIDTGSGAVVLRDVHGSKVDVDTGSGEVTGQDIDAEALGIDSGSGSITLSAIRAPRAELDTGSGEVAVELTGDLRALSVESGSGDVSVVIPRAVGAQLAVETGSGRIETNLVMETQVRKSNELFGRIGDGRGRISIETGSGRVSIRQQGN